MLIWRALSSQKDYVQTTKAVFYHKKRLFMVLFILKSTLHTDQTSNPYFNLHRHKIDIIYYFNDIIVEIIVEI